MQNIDTHKDQEKKELTIQLPADVVDKLHDIASVNDTDIQAIIGDYVNDGIHQSTPEVRKKCFFNHVKEVMKKHNVPQEAIEEIKDKFTY